MPIRWRGLIHQINICGENGGRRRRKIIIKETMEEERRKEGREEIHYNNTYNATDFYRHFGILGHCSPLLGGSARESGSQIESLLFLSSSSEEKKNPAAGIVDCGFQRACLLVGKEKRKKSIMPRKTLISG